MRIRICYPYGDQGESRIIVYNAIPWRIYITLYSILSLALLHSHEQIQNIKFYIPRHAYLCFPVTKTFGTLMR